MMPVEKARTFAREAFRGDSSGHDWFHTLRVYRLATFLAQQEGADVQTVQLAALLHDVDDRKLSPETCARKSRARGFLEDNGVSAERILQILRIIDEVSFRGTDSVRPGTLEGQCVQDADRLDAMGAVGIARTFAYGGSRGRAIYDPSQPPMEAMDAETYASHQSHSINHFYEKLLHLRELMNTPTAKKLAQERHRWLEAFLEEFMAEWNGER